jgi:hypothetical protein
LGTGPERVRRRCAFFAHSRPRALPPHSPCRCPASGCPSTTTRPSTVFCTSSTLWTFRRSCRPSRRRPCSASSTESPPMERASGRLTGRSAGGGGCVGHFFTTTVAPPFVLPLPPHAGPVLFALPGPPTVHRVLPILPPRTLLAVPPPRLSPPLRVSLPYLVAMSRKDTLSREQQALARLLELPENKLCVDCSSKGAWRPVSAGPRLLTRCAAARFAHHVRDSPTRPFLHVPHTRSTHVGFLQPRMLHVYRLLGHPPHDRDAHHQGESRKGGSSWRGTTD